MYEYRATVENVVDGDTIDVAVDLGFKVTTRQRVRLARIDTPERGQSNYLTAKDFVKNSVLGKSVTITTNKVSKWGYYLAEVMFDDKNLNDELVNVGLAKYYFGGHKE